MKVIPLGWRATLFLPITLSAISCERLPTTADKAAPSRPSFVVVPGSGSWTTKAPMPTGRQNLGVAAVNGTVYAVGGNTGSLGSPLATVEAYDPATNTWTTQAPMPTARSLLGVGAVNGILYAVGGFDGLGHLLATLEAYDPVTNTWTTKAPMPTARASLGVAAVNGILYAVGGQTCCDALATVEAYDPATNTWTTKAPMPTARSLLGVGAVNGILYAVGGYTPFATRRDLATLEAYDPTTNTWTTQAPMPTARFELGVGAVTGILYAVGGGNYDEPGPLATVEAYDPVTNTWTTKAPMPTARLGLGVAAVNGILYAVGGSGPGYLATLEAYDPVTATWTTQAPMPTARFYLAVDGIVGTLYAVGGLATTGVSAANEAFTALGPPATLTLSPLTATNTVGTQHCVTATLQDAAGNPVPGVTVRFSVGPSTFPSPSSGSSTTDASGQATFCYTASLPGVDRIHAFADANGNGTQDSTEPFGDAEKTWTPPASTQLCEVTITDAGWIIANNNDRASFGGNAKVLADGTVQGQQKYQDRGPAQPMNVQSTVITATTCSQDRTTASIYGNATIDGAGSHAFRIDVTDAGSGGSNDTYGMRLDTRYTSGQHRLGGGNITIH